ncbi:MAG TPA: NAD(P)H-dependent glycerol-3-phosphate dehydrogenase [Lachnospiraceae bacterium]|nr:NAD(P)H-dependent glycerol-3-phosphate dehydrogenase [Lachnospiraceae bacterium]HCR99791.1 NAD(P)H-dependent glycerol-3-phosphate dehydrogenase [Lachnospiraceae bacterium]
MKNIGVIGAGSWGTALAKLLSDNGHRVTVYSAIASEIDMLNEYHEQKEKLPGVMLPEEMVFTADLEEAMKDKDILVLAVPSPFTRSTAKNMSRYAKKGQLIVSVAKGIEDGTFHTLSEIIREEIKDSRVVVLCGPTHAEEVGKGVPTAIVAGSADEDDALLVQDVFMNTYFRVYTSDDPYGMELGGALKNVIALAAGIADGLGYGDNTKAALITRGIHEVARLGVACGGKRETFEGLTGIGDLIVTCASMHSRNRRAGILIGRGMTADEAMAEVKQVVEGVYSAKAAMHLSAKYGVDMPIVQEVNRVLFENKKPADALVDLMTRDRKSEV